MSDHVNSASAHAHMLVKALENVIRPIVHAYVPGLAANRSTAGQYEYQAGSGPHLEPEAQQLVSALEKFINSLLVRSQVVQHSRTKNNLGDNTLGGTLAMVPASVRQHEFIKTSSRNQDDSKKPPMLKLALEKVRYRVFNKMPIRLLAFKSDGSDMELIERSTIFDRISRAMEADFYQADISSKLRLLTVDDHTTTEENEAVVNDFISQHAKYAILSHTWLRDAPGEVTYTAWKAGEFDRGSAGYQKLAKFCRTAATDHGTTLGWMDTICINKDSSAELDESIRSMYAWYADASVCITYLAQTIVLPHMRNDPWFTRGWTLQELLAPQSIEFYGADWKILPPDFDNGRSSYQMEDEIFAATNIKPEHRQSFRDVRHEIPISERMEWAAKRQVTREEDVAYSLMGIFNVSISIAYGEGSERAFVRLLKEIMNLPGGSSFDILNWAGSPSTLSSYIPSSPEQFLKRSQVRVRWRTPRIPFTLTHLGLHVSILLMPAISAHPDSPHSHWPAIGQFCARANVDILDGPFANKFPRLFNILDKASLRSKDAAGWEYHSSDNARRCRIIFGLLNFTEHDDTVSLSSSNNFAFCFVMRISGLRRIQTSAPAIFNIKRINSSSYTYLVPKSQLGEHGIELRTMYLQ